MTATENIILYHYSFSPFARRISWYLALRGIPYSQCLQPPLMPRPDVARLGISYRRIPILAIGRDVYLDTRLQLRKLEELDTAAPKLGAATGEGRALEQLLASMVIDGGIFGAAALLLPASLPLLKDPAFVRDRTDFMGREYSAEAMRRARPEALARFAAFVDLLETTLLADGRDWLLGGERPGLADIEAIWPLHWLVVGLPGGGALPEELFSAARYPKVYGWIARFDRAVSAATGGDGNNKNDGDERSNKTTSAKPRKLSGEEATRLVTQSAWHEQAAGEVDAKDPVAAAQGLAKGDVVGVSPTDTGASRTDVGTLVGLDKDEVVLEVEAEGTTVRVHAPRHGFRLRKLDAAPPGGKL
ncbi:hypothetical protein CDD83_9698 [Cordyceps sp. RAO-2017]|nr:hypothetical protein CDD83_9698 [Cordyceps sp. RAO-2017]